MYQGATAFTRMPSCAHSTASVFVRFQTPAFAAAALCHPAAHAQSWPTQAVRVVVPFAAGGGTDVLARMLSKKFSDSLGQYFIVENRVGAGGNLGADVVAKAPGDGYTLLSADNGILTMNPYAYRKLPYDPVKAFAPVAMIAAGPNVLAVPPSLGAGSLKELLAMARAKPGKLNYASAGIGSFQHLAGELFRLQGKAEIRLEDYRRSSGKFDNIVSIEMFEAVGEAGIRPNDLAKRLGVSRRTAYRDLKALEMEVDVPIWNEHGRWGVSQSGLLPALRFSRDEALAIVLAARLLAKFATGYDPELGAALMKLGGMLDEPLRSAVERTVSQLSDLRDQPEAQSRLRILANAWVNGRVVEFEYAAAWSNPGTTRTARVHPYLIEPSSATLATYLIGYDETRSAMRTFRADRIVNPRITPSTFVRPKDVELERTLAAAWDIVADQPLEEIVVRDDVDVVLVATSGLAALRPTITALRAA